MFLFPHVDYYPKEVPRRSHSTFITQKTVFQFLLSNMVVQLSKVGFNQLRNW